MPPQRLPAGPQAASSGPLQCPHVAPAGTASAPQLPTTPIERPTKFQFNYWRPITAIRAGNTDGNWATKGDPNWEPFCVTPPFPEYTSTHAATAAAAAGALALELGDRHTFTVTSPTGASRTYNRFSTAAYEEGISRIYCGIHFRTAMNRGFLQGGLIARYVDKNLLRPLDD